MAIKVLSGTGLHKAFFAQFSCRDGRIGWIFSCLARFLSRGNAGGVGVDNARELIGAAGARVGWIGGACAENKKCATIRLKRYGTGTWLWFVCESGGRVTGSRGGGGKRRFRDVFEDEGRVESSAPQSGIGWEIWGMALA